MSSSAPTLCLLTLFAGLLPQPALAQWSKVGEVESLTLYLDRSTIERKGPLRTVIEMQDLRQPDPDGVLSRRYRNEYDCALGMHRIAGMTSFEGPRLAGKRLFDVDETGYWRRIAPGSLFGSSFRQVCADWVSP